MLQNVMGLAGCMLIVAAGVLAAVRGRYRPLWLRCTLLAVVAIGMWIPIDGVPGVMYMRALASDLSITSIFLLCIVVYTQMTNRTTFKPASATLIFALGLPAALFMYPLELGMSQSSPYELGFGSNIFYLALLAIALIAWRVREYLTVYCIVLASAGFLLGVLESRNLWDYLFDTELVFFAPIWLTVRAIQYYLARAKARREAAVPAQSEKLLVQPVA